MRSVDVAADGDDAGERASIEQAQELLALRRQGAAEREALEACEAELLSSVLDGLIAEVARREERVLQSAEERAQGPAWRQALDGGPVGEVAYRVLHQGHVVTAAELHHSRQQDEGGTLEIFTKLVSLDSIVSVLALQLLQST